MIADRPRNAASKSELKAST
jgi:hypothetical protein